ncbi:TonB-dependent receptor [Flavobacterium sp. LC2016-01]|uniref:TonB-dependent receptor family protein n=1 Tax=Flavobacterium sp. LC2016-01 TaxID=2675876 RepID=UPI0012BAAA77|nr:TonB-dependent receptor [Flavobacterium sp. LC2016-01]MTH17675.1 TonB-dependent receptor [Flavobacterium sp. LC2016-01]
MTKPFLIALFLINATAVFSQTTTDTIKPHKLSPVTVEGSRILVDIHRLEPVQGTYIFSGKKNEVIDMTQKNGAITEKYGRQIFAKIPGIFVYDIDGTGNQVNISTRGLDPHRSWEFNVRKDGIITNSDMYGYPASHYNIPMEAVERIELVRGTASLQYGAQFGGMLNYISKQPDSKKVTFETINTLGSYGLVSTYNSLSGTLGKFRYSAWVNGKWITGYRDNSDSSFDAEGISLYYDVSKDLTFKLEWTHSNYITHIPGPLTDSMFYDDPKMSTRSRNYYQPNIHIPSLTADWNVSSSTKLRLTTSAVLGARNSVMFDRPANIADTIVPATLQYNNRQVDIDHFNSYTTELRMLQSYKLFQQTSSLATGIQYMNNDLHRQQQGKGTTGTDFDLSLVTPGWGRDLHFKTKNIALFAENRWLLTKRFSVNTGVRMEIGETNMTGTTIYYSEKELPNKIEHHFPLFGVSAQYDLTESINIYGGWSQAYRPVIFKDIIPQSIYEASDKNLKDAYGYNTEVGFRGKWKYLNWDVTGFYLQYNNRLGTLAQTDSANNLIIFRTNIGDSRTAGLEFFLQGDFSLGKKTSLSLFTSTSFMDARYEDAVVRSGNTNVNIDGNKVESVPSWISRNGITLRYSQVSFSALYSYTAESYADALNIVTPSASGAVGLVPAYQLLDLNLALRLTDNIKLQFNLSNVFDEHYFTKRPQFYPGPGIWPSDGRTFSGTVSIKI